MIIFNEIKNKNKIVNMLGAKLQAFLTIILNPIQKASDRYDILEARVTNDLKWNGQVVYLEKVLNDTFDNVSRYIYIQDVPALTYNTALLPNIEDSLLLTIYNSTDAAAASTCKIYNVSDFATRYDFIVWHPNYLTASRTRILKMVNNYKEASKSFDLQSYFPSS